MQEGDVRSVLDDFDPYIDEIERAELGESRVLVKDELYMPCHPSRDWIKCFVTSTQQDGFRMYLEGSSKRFLLSAKSFDVGKYYISAYEGFPNIDSKPKCGYVAKVERQRDSSFLVSLEYCHLCDERLGKFCCGRSRMEREVVARISHSVKRYKKVNMEFRCISVTIPTISKSGTRKVWCPRSFRKVNPSLPNSADVNEALSCTPKMGMKLVSKLPEWNEDANNLVVRFQGSGRILVASAKNFLLYEDKYSVLDFGEQSMSHLKDPPSSPSVRSNNSVAGQSVSTTRSNAGQAPQKQPTANDSHASTPRTGFAPGTAMDRSNSDTITENDVDLEAIGGDGKAPHSPNSPQHAPLTNKNIEKLKKVHRTTSSNSLPDGEAAGDEASKSSRASSKKSRSKKDTGVLPDGSVRVRVPKKGSTYMDNTAYVNNATSAGATAAASGGVSPKSSSPRAGASTSSASTAGATFVQPAVSSGASTSGSVKSEKESQSQKESRKPPTANNAHKSDTMDAVERSVLQFGKSTATRFVLDFKYPLSPIQAFGIAISAFASDELNDANHEVNHMNSPVIVSRKQMDYSRNRSNSVSSQTFMYSPLKTPSANA